jgi:hypothetical protein
MSYMLGEPSEEDSRRVGGTAHPEPSRTGLDDDRLRKVHLSKSNRGEQ